LNTPAHLILGAAVFARPNATAVTAASVAGSLLPDVSLYAMASWALFVQGISPSIVFGQLYFSDAWQSIFAMDNSVFVWFSLLLAGYWFRRDWVMILGAAALLHLCMDFPLHHDDGRPHFWPFSDWVFSSPVSYWDPARYGQYVGAIEVLGCILLCVLLWRRFRSWIARCTIVIAAAAEAVPAVAPVILGFS